MGGTPRTTLPHSGLIGISPEKQMPVKARLGNGNHAWWTIGHREIFLDRKEEANWTTSIRLSMRDVLRRYKGFDGSTPWPETLALPNYV